MAENPANQSCFIPGISESFQIRFFYYANWSFFFPSNSLATLPQANTREKSKFITEIKKINCSKYTVFRLNKIIWYYKPFFSAFNRSSILIKLCQFSLDCSMKNLPTFFTSFIPVIYFNLSRVRQQNYTVFRLNKIILNTFLLRL